MRNGKTTKGASSRIGCCGWLWFPGKKVWTPQTLPPHSYYELRTALSLPSDYLIVREPLWSQKQRPCPSQEITSWADHRPYILVFKLETFSFRQVRNNELRITDCTTAAAAS